MPYSTFYNLPEEKRQRLMDAVWQEFTSVSYMDVSINKIIQNAGISRGSFYQYFAGKQDLFSYLLSTVYQTIKDIFVAQLTAHNNDLFAAIFGIYDLILWKKSKPRSIDNHQKIYSLMRLNFELDLNQFMSGLNLEEIADSLQTLLLQSGYQPGNQQECLALLHLLMSVGLSNLADVFRHPQREEQNRKVLETQLELIRRGILPRKQEDGHGPALDS